SVTSCGTDCAAIGTTAPITSPPRATNRFIHTPDEAGRDEVRIAAPFNCFMVPLLGVNSNSIKSSGEWPQSILLMRAIEDFRDYILDKLREWTHTCYME